MRGKHMTVHIERIKRLFPKDVCEKMLDIPTGFGTCAYNSARAVLDNMNSYDIAYCEGWLNGCMGHAFNKLVDENGREHYFDISQEYIKAKGGKKGGLQDVELEKELPIQFVTNTFDEDGVAHLISVPAWKGQHTYAQLKEKGLEDMFFD